MPRQTLDGLERQPFSHPVEVLHHQDLRPDTGNLFNLVMHLRKALVRVDLIANGIGTDQARLSGKSNRLGEVGAGDIDDDGQAPRVALCDDASDPIALCEAQETVLACDCEDQHAGTAGLDRCLHYAADARLVHRAAREEWRVETRHNPPKLRKRGMHRRPPPSNRPPRVFDTLRELSDARA
jgi:hypothetical protein